MPFYLPLQCEGLTRQPKPNSTKSDIPTITIVDLTNPINIDADMADPLVIDPTFNNTEEPPELDETPFTDDEAELFEFHSEAFDTALRIDQSREHKEYIAVYGTGPTFIRDFFVAGHTDALEVADYHASAMTLGLQIGRVLRGKIRAYFTLVKKRPPGTGPQDFPDQVEESKRILWEISALF